MKQSQETALNQSASPFHIRPLSLQAENGCESQNIGKYIEDIEGIEHHFPSPWSRAQIQTELAQHNTIVLAAFLESGTSQELLGWSCLHFLEPEAELFKIAVQPDWHRKGIATALLNRLFFLCNKQHCSTLFLEVREQNSSAISLYNIMGFTQIALRKFYYSSPKDHAVVMRKEIELDYNLLPTEEIHP